VRTWKAYARKSEKNQCLKNVRGEQSTVPICRYFKFADPEQI